MPPAAEEAPTTMYLPIGQGKGREKTQQTISPLPPQKKCFLFLLVSLSLLSEPGGKGGYDTSHPKTDQEFKPQKRKKRKGWETTSRRRSPSFVCPSDSVSGRCTTGKTFSPFLFCFSLSSDKGGKGKQRLNAFSPFSLPVRAWQGIPRNTALVTPTECCPFSKMYTVIQTGWMWMLDALFF